MSTFDIDRMKDILHRAELWLEAKKQFYQEKIVPKIIKGSNITLEQARHYEAGGTIPGLSAPEFPGHTDDDEMLAFWIVTIFDRIRQDLHLVHDIISQLHSIEKSGSEIKVNILGRASLNYEIKESQLDQTEKAAYHKQKRLAPSLRKSLNDHRTPYVKSIIDEELARMSKELGGWYTFERAIDVEGKDFAVFECYTSIGDVDFEKLCSFLYDIHTDFVTWVNKRIEEEDDVDPEGNWPLRIYDDEGKSYPDTTSDIYEYGNKIFLYKISFGLTSISQWVTIFDERFDMDRWLLDLDEYLYPKLEQMIYSKLRKPIDPCREYELFALLEPGPEEKYIDLFDKYAYNFCEVAYKAEKIKTQLKGGPDEKERKILAEYDERIKMMTSLNNKMIEEVDKIYLSMLK